jgi:WD40 repeat protein
MVAELKGHTDYAVDVAFSPDGSRLVSLHYSGFMHVWDVETGEEIRRIDGISDSARLEFLPDGESVAVLYNPSYQPFFLIWDIETGNMTRVLSHYFDSREAFNAAVDAQPVPIRVAAFDISPDGSSVVLAFGTRRIVVWDVASGAETQLQEAVDDLPMFNIRYIQYDSTGERVVFTDRDTDQVVILDATSGEQISVIPDTTGHAAVSADGETLVWIVQEENGGAAVLNVSSISDMSQMQSYDIDADTDLNAVPSGVTTVLAAAGGRVVLGGLPIGHVLEENEIFVITP